MTNKEYPCFSGPCDLRFDPVATAALGKEHWRVLADYTVHLSEERQFTVPRGYLTDKGTVPLLLNGAIPRDGKFEQCYVSHDILCEYLTILMQGLPFAIFRSQADNYLVELLLTHGAERTFAIAISQALSSYRTVNQIVQPSTTPEKRKLEADWPDF